LLPSQFGYLLGILYGLYLEGIALFYATIFLLVIVKKLMKSRGKGKSEVKYFPFPVYKKLAKIIYRYLKIFFKAQTISLIVISSIVSNIHIRHVNQRYENFHNSMGTEIEIIGIIVSEPNEREHNYRYIIRGVCDRYKNKRFLLYVRKDRNEPLEYGDLIKLSRRS